jgi:SH3-like domain-containing protein
LTKLRAKVREAHGVPDRPPLSLAVGERVQVGQQDTDWPAFVFVTADAGSGWVPSRHLSAANGEAVVTAPYNTQELATSKGQILEVVERDDESGWHWCRATDGSEGWVPARTLDEMVELRNPGDEPRSR